MQRWNLVLTGFGTVGYHVAELLATRHDYYQQTYGADVRLVAVCGSQVGLYEADGIAWSELAPLTKANGGLRVALRASAAYTGTDFLATTGADVLIEAGPTDFTTGGPAFGYIKTAFAHGMHVVSISKGALVLDYAGLNDLARKHGVKLKMSGATAAALPTIDLVQYNMAGCVVMEMNGIFTGTTNFILTKMIETATSFADALAEAKRLGIAEPDPSFDIDGWDTACKVTILANAAFGARLALGDVQVEGIRSVTLADVLRWQQEQVVPKLVGQIKRLKDGDVQARVGLQLFPLDHPFAYVKGSTKAVHIQTDVMGDLLVIGGKSDPRAAAASALKDFEHLLQLS